MYTRDTPWQSYNGKITKVSDLEDTHLVNIINHLTKMDKMPAFVLFLYEEVNLRGLTKAFVDRAEIPHKNEAGDWMLWDYSKNYPVKVG